jgi:hypothetical protein
MFILDSRSRNPDPKTATKEKGAKIVVIPFFVAAKLKINFFLTSEEKNLGQFKKNYYQIIVLFTQKIVIKLSKICRKFGDPGSEIRDSEKTLFRIPDPAVKKAPDPGSATLSKNKAINTSLSMATEEIRCLYDPWIHDG